ncbi:MAG TPA: hypothetical protein VLT81_04020, partial [Chondromyces sp.]|nr:hypothetical protein [Chondromyces sp.]
LAILLGIGLLMMLARTADPVQHPALVNGALGAMVLVIAVMSLTRHQVRALYLEPFTSQSNHVVTSQWGTFGLFVLILVVGLATVGYMVRRVLTSPAQGADAA